MLSTLKQLLAGAHLQCVPAVRHKIFASQSQPQNSKDVARNVSTQKYFTITRQAA